MSLQRFTKIWTSTAYPPERVAEVALCSTEHHFAVRLPDDYRQAILEVGLPSPTIALLNAIVERELDLHSLGDFFSPREIVEVTEGWRAAGMPTTLVAFASDGAGNMFCFDAADLDIRSDACSAVLFFDHEFGTVDQIATSFSDWIEQYCHIEPWGEGGGT